MGLDAADLDRDGDEEIFIAHLAGETNTLYVNLGGGLFEDGTLRAGLGAPSIPFTGFGAGFADLDLDGWLDLVVVNGAVKIDPQQLADGERLPLEQTNQIFKSTPDGYEKAAAGDAFTAAGVSRGLAIGDLDNDGDPDLLITHNAVRSSAYPQNRPSSSFSRSSSALSTLMRISCSILILRLITMGLSGGSILIVGWQAASSSASTRLTAAKALQLFGDGVGNAIALEPAPEHLINGAADVEIELDGIAVIDIRVRAAQMGGDFRIAADVPLDIDSQCLILEILQHAQRQSSSFATLTQCGGGRIRRVAQHAAALRRLKQTIADGEALGGHRHRRLPAQPSAHREVIHIRQGDDFGEIEVIDLKGEFVAFGLRIEQNALSFQSPAGPAPYGVLHIQRVIGP